MTGAGRAGAGPVARGARRAACEARDVGRGAQGVASHSVRETRQVRYEA